MSLNPFFPFFLSSEVDEFYVYFTETGTIVFTPLEVAQQGFDADHSNFYSHSNSLRTELEWESKCELEYLHDRGPF